MQHELGDHQHEAVLGVPLHLGVLLFDEQRDQRQQPEVRQHDHHAAIRRRLDDSAMRGKCTIFLRICKSNRAAFSRR